MTDLESIARAATRDHAHCGGGYGCEICEAISGFRQQWSPERALAALRCVDALRDLVDSHPHLVGKGWPYARATLAEWTALTPGDV